MSRDQFCMREAIDCWAISYSRLLHPEDSAYFQRRSWEHLLMWAMTRAERA